MKKQIGVEVWAGKELVNKLDIEVFDTIEEAISWIAENRFGGDIEKAKAFVLDRFNTQYGTDARNKARQAASATPPAKALQAQAVTRIFGDPTKMARMASLSGDAVAVQAFIEEEVKTLKEELEAKRKTAVAEANKADEEGEGGAAGDGEQAA